MLICVTNKLNVLHSTSFNNIQQPRTIIQTKTFYFTEAETNKCLIKHCVVVFPAILCFTSVGPLLTSTEAIWECSHLMSLVYYQLPCQYARSCDYIVQKFSTINDSI